MGELVNLRGVRKAKARQAAAATADANRAAFGRTAAERLRSRDDTARRDRILDGAKTD